MKKFLPLDPKKGIFRWGPIPGRYFYISEFQDAIFNDYLKLYKGDRWPNTLSLFKEKRMIWLDEFPALRTAGRNVFVQYMLPTESRSKLKKKWDKIVEELTDFESNLDKKSLRRLSNEGLYRLWEEFYKIIIAFWLPTVPAELGNYGSAKLLESKLRNFISDNDKIATLMEVLTAPESPSFYQEEEADLAKTHNLERHQKKYFWLRNSYNGAEILPIDFFAQRKKRVNPNLEKLMRKRLEETKNKKKEMISKYKLPQKIIDIATALCEGMAWQDERKKYIFIYTHYKEMFLKEVARRFDYPIDSLRNCSSEENIAILKGKDMRPKIEKRGDIFGFYLAPDAEELSNEEALLCWDIYSEEQINGGVNEIKGIIASAGKEKIVRGKARIVLDPKKSESFQKGNILVASMTSPEYIFVMKKAKAIITDAGGLTSHAAIVSRELEIPCIVNTKIATKILKDGQLVEVDANKGIIRLLK